VGLDDFVPVDTGFQPQYLPGFLPTQIADRLSAVVDTFAAGAGQPPANHIGAQQQGRLSVLSFPEIAELFLQRLFRQILQVPVGMGALKDLAAHFAVGDIQHDFETGGADTGRAGFLLPETEHGQGMEPDPEQPPERGQGRGDGRSNPVHAAGGHQQQGNGDEDHRTPCPDQSLALCRRTTADILPGIPARADCH
jgi:hypothetical protein